jgi:hemerythrin-like metal-binding protein
MAKGHPGFGLTVSERPQGAFYNPKRKREEMEWKTEYATGIQNIDDQHQKILELMTLFEGLPGNSADWSDMHKLILRTRAFMAYHFSVEESLMQLLPYADSAVHRAEHRYVLESLADLEGEVRRKIRKDELVPLMRHLLFDHLVGSDQHFARHALAKWRDFGNN